MLKISIRIGRKIVYKVYKHHESKWIFRDRFFIVRERRICNFEDENSNGCTVLSISNEQWIVKWKGGNLNVDSSNDKWNVINGRDGRRNVAFLRLQAYEGEKGL